jgi:ankyrin repeat protein
MAKLWQSLKQGWQEAKNKSDAHSASSELLKAAEKGETETVKALLDQGADANARKGPDTALMLAASGGHAETARFLLERGADINPRSLYDWCSFHTAVLGGSAEVVRLFLERGADVNAKDPEHEITALMGAAENGYLEIAGILLDKGAEINAYNWMGQTAYMLAEEDPAIQALLREKGARPEPPEDW